MLWYQTILLAVIVYCSGIQSSDLQNIAMSNSTFLYFGYGSNLLAKRLLINNPTAIRRGPAKLMGYRLDFNGFAQRWGGAVATIIPDEYRHVWGALWEINSSDLDHLDRQEGVSSKVYTPIEINVENLAGESLGARSYQYIQCPAPPPPQSNTSNLGTIFQQIPMERRPSPEYRRIMIIGACETGLPQDYIDALEQIPHNNYQGNSGLNVIPLDEFHRTGCPEKLKTDVN